MMKKNVLLLLPILIILVIVVSREEAQKMICLKVNTTEQYHVEYFKNEKVDQISIFYEGDLKQSVTSTTLPGIREALETSYRNVDGVKIEVNTSPLGNTYAKIAILVDPSAYHFGLDALLKFDGLYIDDSLYIDDFLNYMEANEYTCN